MKKTFKVWVKAGEIIQSRRHNIFRKEDFFMNFGNFEKPRTPLYGLVAALFIGAACLVAGCSGSGDNAYETFSLAMDKLAGEGKWSAKGHSTSFFGGDLTVEGVTVNMEKEGQTFEIATVELKKPLAKEELQSILDAADWKDRKETKLADGLVLKGLKRSWKQKGDATATSSLDELNLESLSLTAADSNAMAGLPGFLKAARIGKASYKNMKGTSTSPGGTIDMEMGLGQMMAENMAFDAPPLEGLDELDPSGLATVISSFSAKSISFKDMSMKMGQTEKSDEKSTMTFSLAGLDQKDVKGFRSLSSLTVTGMKFNMEGNDPQMTFGLESMSLNEADLTEYIAKIMPAIVASATGETDPEEAINNMQTFADFFVSPFSLKDMAVKGFEFSVGDLITIKLAESKVNGPLKAGTIPDKQQSTITGLEIILPEDPKHAEGEAAELYKFGQDFGMTRFVVDAAGEATYDPATGKLTTTTTKLVIKDLLEATGGLTINGLTAERLQVLKDTNLNAIFMVLLSPESIFGDIALDNLDITYTNKGLVERIYAYVGKTELDGAPAEQVQTMAAGAVSMGLAMQGSQYMENADVLAKSLTAFLQDPKTIRITLKPEPPLSFTSARAFEGDQNKILNSLNLTLIVNGEEGATPLRFNLPERQAPTYNLEDLDDMTDEEWEEYLKELEAEGAE
ncbi:hypothetical protein C4J81_12165 [Deltaproteobacteria bacterium Smac51]|nr:hypothetical protein C4J81_12165 [Deltaproteobacteria bacterium Smac51]